jgi:hypothetical protein
MTWMSKRTLAAVVAVVLGAAGPGAAAGGHPLVVLTIDPCMAIADEEVRRVVGIELAGVLADPADRSREHTHVAVVCAGELVELRVDDPITGKALQRTIDLREAPEARPRLLALAIVELISASWTELETNPEPQVPPVSMRASHESRQAALDVVQQAHPLRAAPRPLEPARTRLVAIAGGMGWFSGTGLLAGGGVRITRDNRHHIDWMADLQAHRGSARVSVGTVKVDALSAGAVLAQRAWPTLGLHLGLGVRAGGLHLRGEPDAAEMETAHSGWAPWGGPMGLVTVSLAASRHLVFDLAAESGYVALEAGGLVDGVRELAVKGPWIGVHAGIQIF